LRLCLNIGATYCDEHDDDVVLVFSLSLERKFEKATNGIYMHGFSDVHNASDHAAT
jgi:hypothetical protein